MKRLFFASLFLLSLFTISPTFVSAQEGDGGIGTKPNPKQITLIENIEYIKHGNKSYKLDICQPKNIQGMAPAVILTHGGGFRKGSKADLRDECVALAQLGFIGVSVDYRLTTVAPYPAQIDDVQYAVRWIRSNATKYHVNTQKIGALGGSAGGYLATMLGVRDTRDGSLGLSEFSSQVQVVINRSGAPMNAADPTTLPDENGPFGSIRDEILKGYVGNRTLDDALLREISPVTYVTSKSSPLLAVYSTNDEFAKMGNATAIVNALKQVGVVSRLETFEGVGKAHGRSRLPSSEQEKLWEIEKHFLQTYLGSASPDISPKPTSATTPAPGEENPAPVFNIAFNRPIVILKAIGIVALVLLVLFLVWKK